MPMYPSNLYRHVRNHDGVALPVALFALVAVTILVTSLLLSSATEVSLSAAHQDATRGLFTAEGAVEAYVAQNQLALARVDDLRYLPAGGSARDSVLLTVSVLGRVANPTPTFPDDTTFAITASPIRGGGRQVVAMIDKVNRPTTMNVEGGLISGDNLDIKGNTTVSDGSDSKICADSVGGKALQSTQGTTVSLSNQAQSNLIGENEKIATAKGDLVRQLFGTDLQSLIAKADIKFTRATAVTGSVLMTNAAITSEPVQPPQTANKLTPQNTPYNWGCPADVYGSYGTGQNSTVWTTACVLDGDETHMPLVAIDAQGGTVNVNLSHGQGMLIVYNGNFTVAGNFAYKGVILVEGNFDIRATGGGSIAPKIEGAVIGLGFGTNNVETVDDNTTTGSPTIRYNRCAVNMLRNSWETTKPFLRMGGRTFGWFEVVR